MTGCGQHCALSAALYNAIIFSTHRRAITNIIAFAECLCYAYKQDILFFAVTSAPAIQHIDIMPRLTKRCHHYLIIISRLTSFTQVEVMKAIKMISATDISGVRAFTMTMIMII